MPNSNQTFFSPLFQSDAPQRHDPMVAMICPEKQGDPVSRLFHNQYVSSDSGKWTTDSNNKATCKTDKVEILEYCKKVSKSKQLNSWLESWKLYPRTYVRYLRDPLMRDVPRVGIDISGLQETSTKNWDVFSFPLQQQWEFCTKGFRPLSMERIKWASRRKAAGIPFILWKRMGKTFLLATAAFRSFLPFFERKVGKNGGKVTGKTVF